MTWLGPAWFALASLLMMLGSMLISDISQIVCGILTSEDVGPSIHKTAFRQIGVSRRYHALWHYFLYPRSCVFCSSM